MRGWSTLLLLAACAPEATPEPFTPEPTVAADTDDTDVTEVVVEPPEVVPPEAADDPLDGFPCAEQRACAPSPPYVDDTCCAVGDPITQLGQTVSAETVHVATDGRYVVSCGGFGAQVADIGDPQRTVRMGTAGPRCQHATFGGVDASGARIVWLAHHGDTWVSSPTLWTFHLDADADLPVRQVDAIAEPGALFGDLAARGDVLYAAMHQRGLRVYTTSESGVPTLVREQVLGLDNLRELDLDGDHLYGLDGDALVVFDLTDPLEPVEIARLPTRPGPRDVDVHAGRAWIALGSAGLDVHDVTDPAAPAPLRQIYLLGSAQAVAVRDDHVAVSAWDHVAVLDPDSGVLLGTERVTAYPHFEQDLGIAVTDDRILVGEWEGTYLLRYNEGRVAPDVWNLSQSLSFDSDAPGVRTLELRNRGPLPLSVSDLHLEDPAFTLVNDPVELPPGGEVRIEVGYQPPSAEPTSLLSVSSDDPDTPVLPVPLHTIGGGFLTEGDVLNGSFAVFDPTGANNLENMRGTVFVLAYFALF
jgi:hypothetical protein